MPVLLDEEDEERWLACGFDEAVAALARPFPSQLMSMAQEEPARGGTSREDGGGRGGGRAEAPELDLG
ncbi:hypothetical protein AB5I41_25050 [Sphingomonas sp. MMS24-JH45]